MFLVVAVLLGGAVLSLLFGAQRRWSGLAGACSAVAACACGVFEAFRYLRAGTTVTAAFAWSVPNATFVCGVDPLSAFFLVPLFVMGGLAACFGCIYLEEHAPNRNLAVPWAAFNTMLAGMVLVLIARHALPFLFAWEVMSVAAFVLIAFDHQEPEVQRASYIYLIAAHVGVTCLLGLFLVLGARAESFEFGAMLRMPVPTNGSAALLFGLALVGFGAKAGVFPLHVWLPEAHGAAPTHVSAVMSGVLVKMGVYGLLRAVLLIGGPRPYWGPVMMLLGVIGGLVGIGCSLYQRDIKRLLAYSTVENIGLICLGLGTAFWCKTSDRPEVATLALIGALLHVWNHAAMKGLMFLGAGSLAHRCHTRDLERLGGLWRRMPQTGIVILLGSVAMAGLPPLNGLLSEWLILSGLMRAALSSVGGVAVALVVTIGAVSLIGAMAALGFARLVGVALLGEPRSKAAAAAHEPSRWMRLPMYLTAALCMGIALRPTPVIDLFHGVAAQFLGYKAVSVATLGLEPVATINRVLLGACIGSMCLVALLGRRRDQAASETWGCGYVAPTARMQYTGRGFSELFTSNMLTSPFAPRSAVATATGLFPDATQLTVEMNDPVTRGLYEPWFERVASRFVRLRVMQQGILHVYVLYILVTLVVALAWATAASVGGSP
ncbi:MAG TPA: proton-conducting transporter membrane subunit [Polyangiaceae bacterium]